MAARIRKAAVEEAIEHLRNASLGSRFIGATFNREGEFLLSPSAQQFTADVLEATSTYRRNLIELEIDRALDLLEAELRRDEPPATPPVQICDRCHRETVSPIEFGQVCNMQQPSGERCLGLMRHSIFARSTTTGSASQDDEELFS